MEESYRDGLAEVDMILNYADEESLNKLPYSLKKFIKENKSNYNAQINPEKDLKDQKLLYETKVILSVLYRDYWAPQEEREKLLENEKKELLQIQNSKHKKYSYYNLFKQKNNETNEDLKVNSLVVKKENLIKRILYKIKKFLKVEGK